LTPEERQFLVDLLEMVQRDTLVEEHRTRVLNYREDILRREKLLDSLLGKLRPARG
jgi:hypothetical protein